MPTDSFGWVQLVVLDDKGATYDGEFFYQLKLAHRDAATGAVQAVGSSEMTCAQHPPTGFEGLPAGTYILRCVLPRYVESSPGAGSGEIVVEVQGGTHTDLTVRLQPR